MFRFTGKPSSEELQSVLI